VGFFRPWKILVPVVSVAPAGADDPSYSPRAAVDGDLSSLLATIRKEVGRGAGWTLKRIEQCRRDVEAMMIPKIAEAGGRIAPQTVLEEMRRLLAEILKEKLLKIGREFERREEWAKHRTLTPFQPGEDPDLIDEERSLDNILDIGRRIEEIRYDDFLMRQREKQKRHIIFILDISKEFEKKLQIAKVYKSQFAYDDARWKYISSSITAKNQYYGNLIRVDYGEPFMSREQVGLKDIRDVI